MDLSTHPVVVIIATLASLASVASAVWLSLVYIRNRFLRPALAVVTRLTEAADMVPLIKAQLFNNGGSTLRDAVDKLSNHAATIENRICLMESREKALIQEHDLGVFVADADGKTTWVNRTYCRLFGITENEALGLGWKNYIAPSEREAYTREWESAVADRREFYREVTCMSALDGSELVFKVRAYPLDNTASNTQRGYTGFLEHIESTTITRVMG